MTELTTFRALQRKPNLVVGSAAMRAALHRRAPHAQMSVDLLENAFSALCSVFAAIGVLLFLVKTLRNLMFFVFV